MTCVCCGNVRRFEVFVRKADHVHDLTISLTDLNIYLDIRKDIRVFLFVIFCLFSRSLYFQPLHPILCTHPLGDNNIVLDYLGQDKLSNDDIANLDSDE
jgi:hypothetical protein